MDGSTGRLLIKRRKAALEEATGAATAEPADLAKAKALLEQANTIDAILAKIGEPDRHLLAKIAAFACLTLVAVALSNLIRVGGPRISLQAETSELSFLVTPDSTLVPRPSRFNPSAPIRSWLTEDPTSTPTSTT